MTASLFAICLVNTSSNTLFYSHRLNLLRYKTSGVTNKKSTSAWRQRHRRARRAPSNPSTNKLISKKRRRADTLTGSPKFLQHVSLSFSHSNIVPNTLPQPSSREPATDPPCTPERRRPVRKSTHRLYDIMEDSTPQRPTHRRSQSGSNRGHTSKLSSSDAMPPPPPPTDDAFESPPSSFGARSTRSLSTTSRNSNRLSLTLPIALPSNAPSRPTPISTTAPSFPPTPKDTPTVRSPTDANDFIHAIAAQERRVLELRDELKGAEAELARLKKQWGAFDSVRKRNAIVNGEPLRTSVSLQNSPNVEDVEAKRRSIELDRRRSMLMSQQLSREGTPNSGRRRVMRGGHTRALSLLSPTKPDAGFSMLEEALNGRITPVKDSEPHLQHLARPCTAQQISKRATWTPRSAASSPSNTGVKQMAEDFKAGLWTFVEDLRQVAVGDEPINGGGSLHRRGSGRQSDDRDRDTIRASVTSCRPHVANAFNNSSEHTPTPTARFFDPLKESDTANMGRPKRTNSKRTKHFSWTPLTTDLDDMDWSNWDSPPVPSPRWSGSTATGDIMTTAIPEGDNTHSNDASTK